MDNELQAVIERFEAARERLENASPTASGAIEAALGHGTDVGRLSADELVEIGFAQAIDEVKGAFVNYLAAMEAALTALGIDSR